MKLPWLQLERDVFSKAELLAGVLEGTDYNQAIGMLARLWRFALSQGRAEDPPTGLLESPRAARLIAIAVGWSGAEADLIDALVDTGFLERLPNGLRIRGVTRYQTHWRRIHNIRSSGGLRPTAQRPSSNLAVTAQRPLSNCAPDVDVDVDRETRREKKKQKKQSLAPLVSADAPSNRTELSVVPDEPSNGKTPTPQALLVEAWSVVYLAKTGQPYRHQRPDFVLATDLVKQGVTPDETRLVAERAFRPGIEPWLAVRNFKQLATRWSDIAVARSKSSAFNVATQAEIAAQKATPEGDL